MLGRSASRTTFRLYRRSGQGPHKTSSRQIRRPADGENPDGIIRDDASGSHRSRPSHLLQISV